MYQVIESRDVYDGMICDIRIDDIKISDDIEIRREVILQKPTVSVLPIDDDGKILLVRQYRHPIGRYAYEIPAGFIEDGETPQECAARETAEEIGFKPGRLDFVCAIHPAIGISNMESHIFIGRDLVETGQSLDHDEFLTVERRGLDECMAMIKTGEISSAQTVVALLAYFYKH